MLYTRKRFSVPSAPSSVTQEEWDAIFSNKAQVNKAQVNKAQVNKAQVNKAQDTSKGKKKEDKVK